METADPITRVQRGEALLSLGHYAEGFRLYDAWRQMKPEVAADWPLPHWNGEDLQGRRFLVAGEQGFGDQIMHARFGKLLQARGAQVIWIAKPPLVRLFRECLGLTAVPLGTHIEGVSLYSPSSRLPNHFFPPLTEPPGAPYLQAPPPNVIPGLTLGIVPAGNPKFSKDAARSLPAELAKRLLDLPGAVDLRPEHTGARDFYDTATIIAGLDLVITVDTAVAHLAGAMGKPVWILLPHQADWRWLQGREDSPWYSTARLFRQSSPGAWAEVVTRVEQTYASQAGTPSGAGDGQKSAVTTTPLVEPKPAAG
jgi:hypothetical protein